MMIPFSLNRVASRCRAVIVWPDSAPDDSASAEPDGSDTVDNSDDSCIQYVLSEDGKPVPLVLQSFKDPSQLPHTSKWLRLSYPPSPATLLAKVSYWIWSPALEAGSLRQRYGARVVGEALLRLVVAWPISFSLVHNFEIRMQQRLRKLPNLQDLQYEAVRTLGSEAPNHAASWSTGPQPDQSRPEDLNHGRQGYTDDIRLSSNLQIMSSQSNDSGQAVLIAPSDQGAAARPRYLCFIQDYENELYQTIYVSEFIQEHGHNVDIEFVFVSYTREQFRVATDAEIDRYDKYENESIREANRELAKRDRRTLIRWAIDAAKKAGKKAFWIDFECVRDQDGMASSTSKSDDVYRICDVVRAAHSMIIAISPPASEKVDAIISGQESFGSGPGHTTQWLRHWGSRLWTLPELLLSPSEHRVRLYVFGDDCETATLAKRNFAERAWDDAELVKELVNHYEGSAILTQLRLIETALACFARRGTLQFTPGDIAYAIMGLLPLTQRPLVHHEDSGFQAFARLSLANGDGNFLERLICLLPAESDAPWYDTNDVWGAKLSNVQPSSQVSKVLEADTLLLDGVYGATIRWDGFGSSASTGEVATGKIWHTLEAVLVIPWMLTLMAVIYNIMFYIIFRDPTFRSEVEILTWLRRITIAIVIFLPMVAALIAPLLYVISRRSTRRPIKAQLVGIEGHVDAAAIERHLWGFNHGRLALITNCLQFRDEIPEAQNERQPDDDRHALTLVDLHMMTVLHFYARNPPVAFFIAGKEGGLQRAVLCSYDCRKDIFTRETVARVETKMLDEMKRVGRFRLRLNAPKEAETTQSNLRDLPDNTRVADVGLNIGDATSSGKTEFVFLIILLMTLGINGPSDVKQFSNGRYNPIYSLSFIASEIAACVLLSRLSTPQILSYAATLKGCLPILAFAGYLHIDTSVILPLLEGFADGILIPVLITVIWSWYRPEILPFRILIFALFRRQVVWLFFLMLPRGSGFAAGPLLYSLLCLFVAAGGGRRIARPMEVSWLPAYRRLKISRCATTAKYASIGTISWAESRRSWLKDLQPFIFFGVSVSTFMATDTPRMPRDGRFGLHMIFASRFVVLLCLWLLLYRSQRIGIPLILLVTMLSFTGTMLYYLLSPVPASLVIYLLMDLREMILPLSWLLSIYNTDSWASGLQMLAFSLAGMTSAKLIKLPIPVVAYWKVCLPMGLSAIGLLCYFWVYEKRRRRGRNIFLQ